MSSLRHLLESIDSIAEAGPKGLQPRPWELTPLEGGAGGAGMGGGRVSPMSPPPAARSGIGQGVSTAKPKIERLPGETPAQAVARAQSQLASRPLPAGVTPSTAGAGRGTVNPAQIKPLPKTGPLKQNPARAELQAQQAQQNLMKSAPGPGPKMPPSDAVTKKDVAKSVAGHAALAATGLLGATAAIDAAKTKDKSRTGGQEGGGTPAGAAPTPQQSQVSDVEMYRPEDLAAMQQSASEKAAQAAADKEAADIATSTKTNVATPATTTASSAAVELPKVGPQGANSPFVVLPANKPVEPTRPTSTQMPRVEPSTRPSVALSPVVPTAPSTSTGRIGRTQGDGTGGQGTGTGTGSGSGVGAGSGLGQAGDGTGSGLGKGGGGTSIPSGDPFPMMRYMQDQQKRRTNEHRSVNKLVKEFKRFVSRKL